MAYSCSDFTDDVLNCLGNCGAINPEVIPDDDPESQANVVLAAIVAMNRSVLASRFVRELLAGVESVGELSDDVAVLTWFFYLQAAINNDTVVEAVESEMAAVTVIRTLPSADEWMKYVLIA
ncbi:hypothetical protein [Paraburkholderia domus]|uniref:hypothetical protein n=1 Tax=Paraburkholderia domus TaxID=2793075 RepID=UPI001912CAD2|nr:hypothetical protein [Paraburkholderia domus]MBK5065799.1 hypothetical protein [Burkholderia sp. R-70199]CAE6963257.1 hypothetical protein R70199_07489 [Paraburkholderia domus]